MRASLNEMKWFENQIILFIQVRFSGKAVCVVGLVLVGSPSSELESITVCFVKFLTLLGRFWKILRASLNDMDWLENQINRFI